MSANGGLEYSICLWIEGKLVMVKKLYTMFSILDVFGSKQRKKVKN
jgi:hypothetical protein